MEIGSLLGHWARYRPDDVAVVCGDARVTNAAHARRVNQAARALLALGLAPGDRLALVMGNRLELLELYRAAALLGIVAVPLSPLLLAPALDALLRDSGSAVVLSDSASAPLVAQAVSTGRHLVLDEWNRLIDALPIVAEPDADRPLPVGVDLPDDDRPILLAAIEARATHLLTGNFRDFHPLYGRPVEGVLILRPADYPPAVPS